MSDTLSTLVAAVIGGLIVYFLDKLNNDNRLKKQKLEKIIILIHEMIEPINHLKSYYLTNRFIEQNVKALKFNLRKLDQKVVFSHALIKSYIEKVKSFDRLLALLVGEKEERRKWFFPKYKEKFLS